MKHPDNQKRGWHIGVFATTCLWKCRTGYEQLCYVQDTRPRRRPACSENSALDVRAQPSRSADANVRGMQRHMTAGKHRRRRGVDWPASAPTLHAPLPPSSPKVGNHRNASKALCSSPAYNPTFPLHRMRHLFARQHLMVTGSCSVCEAAPAKYKCPTCSIAYCSLTCFKSEKHQHVTPQPPPALAPHRQNEDHKTASENGGAEETTNPPSVFQSIADDAVIRRLLSYKSLQVHLATLLNIMHDSSITNEAMAENRRELANLRLCDLRMGGAEQNELVEEFVSRVIELWEKPSAQPIT